MKKEIMLYMLPLVHIQSKICVSIIVEHGGSGSSAAAPMATKLFKLIVDRHQYRKKLSDYKEFRYLDVST